MQVSRSQILFALVLNFLVGGCASPPPVASFRSIEGIVRDSTNSTPVARCTVLAVLVSTHRPYITRTNNNGEYCFNHLPPGKYVLGFIAPTRREVEGIFVDVFTSFAVRVDYQIGTSPPRRDVLQELSSFRPEVMEADSVLQDH